MQINEQRDIWKDCGKRAQLCLYATHDAMWREIRRDDLQDEISTSEASFWKNPVAIERRKLKVKFHKLW